MVCTREQAGWLHPVSGRQKTTERSECQFSIGCHDFRSRPTRGNAVQWDACSVFDIGGTRLYRRQWKDHWPEKPVPHDQEFGYGLSLPVLQTSVVFLVSLCEYNQVLYEDD